MIVVGMSGLEGGDSIVLVSYRDSKISATIIRRIWEDFALRQLSTRVPFGQAVWRCYLQPISGSHIVAVLVIG